MEEYARILITILIGLFSGVIGGASGIVASFIIMPAFYLLGVFNVYSKAVGTTLFSLLFPISILAVLEYAKQGDVDYKIAIILTLSYLVFSYLGAKLNLSLKNTKRQYLLKYFIAGLMIFSGIFFGYKAYTDDKNF